MNFPTEISGLPLIEIPVERWIFEQIERWAQQFPERFAFALDQAGRVEEYRYADVLKQAAQVSAGLAAQGIQQGDRIGILMENIPQWVFALLGTMRLGAITVPLATALPQNSLRRVAEHSGCRLIFTDASNLEKVQELQRLLRIAAVGFNCVGEGIIPWTKFVDPSSVTPPEAQWGGDDTAVIMYTSGTTGDPKGVQLTMRNLVHEIHSVVEPLDLSPDHRILSILPFSHVLPLIANGLGSLCVGAGVVFLSSISPQRVVDAFHRHRITFFICVPEFFYVLHRRIFAQMKERGWPARKLFQVMFYFSRKLRKPSISRVLLSSLHQAIGPELRWLASGGSRFDPRIAQDLSDLGYVMLQAYGLTETSAAATVTPPRENRIGTVGKPIRGVIVRIDQPSHEGIGEVWIRGPIIMKGYYRDAAKTAEAMQGEWFRTGDLGFIRPDGNLVITGRSKDVIVLTSGEKVYPEEMEAHYSQSLLIKEICLVGVRQERGPVGESLHAIVVPDLDEFRRRRETAIMETVRFEIENLSKALPPYQRIHSISIRHEPFPRTVTRKLKRFEIQAQEAERQHEKAKPGPTEDHPIFKEGIAGKLAALVHEAKPEAGGLDPSMNLELDLGFDSLERVELLGTVEAQLGVSVSDEDANRIFTLGELIHVLEAAVRGESTLGRDWKEILNRPSKEAKEHYILQHHMLSGGVFFVARSLLRLISSVFFRLNVHGREKLPAAGPFILCPNHESFLDGPLVSAALPFHILKDTFFLGYSTYWDNFLTRRIAQALNIVAIDPNVNLVRAMQVGAEGLRQNKVAMVFPEGSRSIDGRVAEFKKGAAILAYELNVPIVPVGVRGTFEAWPRGGGFRLHGAEIHIGDPIDPCSIKSADPYTDITKSLRARVKELAGQL
jgi:long-chain acyl-CoA synthetase